MKYLAQTTIGEGLSPAQMREQARAWYNRQIEVIAQAPSPSWPEHKDWINAYLQEAKRKGLPPFDPMEDDLGNDISSAKRHCLVFNGHLAEIVAQYLCKGSQIYVEGQICTRKYQDRDGIEKDTTDIRVDQMQMRCLAQGPAYSISPLYLKNVHTTRLSMRGKHYR